MLFRSNLSLKIFDFQDPESVGGNRVKQVVKLRKGLSQEIAKKLSKIVRDELKKVTVAKPWLAWRYPRRGRAPARV